MMVIGIWVLFISYFKKGVYIPISSREEVLRASGKLMPRIVDCWDTPAGFQGLVTMLPRGINFKIYSNLHLEQLTHLVTKVDPVTGLTIPLVVGCITHSRCSLNYFIILGGLLDTNRKKGRL